MSDGARNTLEKYLDHVDGGKCIPEGRSKEPKPTIEGEQDIICRWLQNGRNDDYVSNI